MASDRQVQDLRAEVRQRAMSWLSCRLHVAGSLKSYLHVQMQKLELKLAELHATDVKALDRAYQSQCQHVDALQLESTVQAPISDKRFHR